jgi:hypothetical protein
LIPQTYHKYGLELPNTVEDTYAIEKAIGTDFWCDALEYKMKNVCVAFVILGMVSCHHRIIAKVRIFNVRPSS